MSKFERPYWWPQLAADPEYLAQLRDDMPEDTQGMDDEELAEWISDGWKYSDTWDHLGDAREEYEPLADAFFDCIEALRKVSKGDDAAADIARAALTKAGVVQS